MKWSVLICLFFVVSLAQAQAPQYFNYQAVARDADGNVITGAVSVRFTLHEDNAGGAARYTETHQAVTNDQGVFALAIGDGSVVNGNMNNVNWAQHQYFLQVELKPNGSSSYNNMGTAQLLSVPYAMYAAQSGSTLAAGTGIQIQNNTISNTGDLSSSNELQSLSVNGNQLSISNGNSVTLPTGTTYTAGSGISINGNTISATDASTTNEIQTLSINGNQLSLSNGGGSVQLPAGNSSWTTNGAMTYNNPTSNDVSIGTESNSNSKLNVVSTGNKHAGNFTSPGAGDAVHAYCNGAGAGVAASSLNGTGGSFTSLSGTAGYFSSTSGKGLIVDQGNVGIGKNNPESKLDVIGTVKIVGEQNTSTNPVKIYNYSSHASLEVESYGTGNGAFIGAASGKALSVENSGPGGMETGLRIGTSLTHWDVYVDTQFDLNFAHYGTLRAWISDTDGTYHNFSDSRLKQDIKPYQNVLGNLTKLQAYTYRMKNADEHDPLSVGFIAQEVEKQFPELVVEKDGYKSICYDHFAVLSVEAIKEQQKEIETLNQVISAQQLQLNAENEEVGLLRNEVAELKQMLLSYASRQ